MLQVGATEEKEDDDDDNDPFYTLRPLKDNKKSRFHLICTL
jgi:hypothetical protein